MDHGNRQDFHHGLLEALDLRDALIRTGLDDVMSHYMDTNYADRIEKSSEITIFAMNAHTWISRYSMELTGHLAASGNTLTLCVPALDNHFLDSVATLLDRPVADFKLRIAESIGTVVQCANRGRLGERTTLRVIGHRARPSYSLYKFDDRILVVTYYATHPRRRAPTFEFMDVPGSLFEEFSSDLQQAMTEKATVIYDSSDGTDRLKEELGDYVPGMLERTV